jgi:type 1 glutamine amidotransferase
MRDVPARFEIQDEAYFVDERATGSLVLVRTTRSLAGSAGPRSGEEPQVWTREWGGARVFVSTFGHDAASQSHPAFLALMRAGILWASRR